MVEQVSLWYRDSHTGQFRAAGSPATTNGRQLDSLKQLLSDGSGYHVPLEHEEALIGVLETRPSRP